MPRATLARSREGLKSSPLNRDTNRPSGRQIELGARLDVVVSGHIIELTNTMPLHIEVLYNDYAFAAPSPWPRC
jgi:hypothetical protein